MAGTYFNVPVRIVNDDGTAKNCTMNFSDPVNWNINISNTTNTDVKNPAVFEANSELSLSGLSLVSSEQKVSFGTYEIELTNNSFSIPQAWKMVNRFTSVDVESYSPVTKGSAVLGVYHLKYSNGSWNIDLVTPPYKSTDISITGPTPLAEECVSYTMNVRPSGSARSDVFYARILDYRFDSAPETAVTFNSQKDGVIAVQRTGISTDFIVKNPSSAYPSITVLLLQG